MFLALRRPRRGGAPGRLGRLGLREHRRRRRAALDPDGPAVGADVPGGGRRLDADPPLLGGLHGRRPRLLALLRLPELLRLQHAAAGPGGQLLPADRRLGVRRRGLVLPDQLLVPPHDGDAGRHQGVRHQRARRRRARARHVLRVPRHRHARLPDRRSRGIDEAFSVNDPSSSRAASCCWSARSRSPPRCRCTPGSRTPWRARRRSPR